MFFFFVVQDLFGILDFLVIVGDFELELLIQFP